MGIMNITLKWNDEDGEEVTHSFPAKFEVCDSCEGHGTHLHESIRGNTYTREEFNEAFDDDDSQAEYFRHGGRFDVTCSTCKGKNVVQVVDEAKLSAEQKRLFAEYQEWLDEEEQERGYDRMTRRAECGVYC